MALPFPSGNDRPLLVYRHTEVNLVVWLECFPMLGGIAPRYSAKTGAVSATLMQARRSELVSMRACPQFLTWACSSMVEQWPFKPLVLGSSPSGPTKTISPLFFLPSQGSKSETIGVILFLLAKQVPAAGKLCTALS